MSTFPFLLWSAPVDAYNAQAEARPDPSVDLDNARLAIAHAYSFRDWSALRTHAEAMQDTDSREYAFEQGAEAVIDGDTATLTQLLTASPTLVHERSRRVTRNDPAVHGATLLHYVAANGVEDYRQRSPANAVAIAQLLLNHGANPEALMDAYSGSCSVLSMLVSSAHPAARGVQAQLATLLVQKGADPEGRSATAWQSPMLTALVFGYTETARALVAIGAHVDTIVKAAGLGEMELCTTLLPSASADERHQALAVAVGNGQCETARLLLQAGEDPNRFNPTGFHAHQTPLHGAAVEGRLELAELLTTFGARTDTLDTLWNGTPLDWARHGGQQAMIDYLLAVSPCEPPNESGGG